MNAIGGRPSPAGGNNASGFLSRYAELRDSLPGDVCVRDVAAAQLEREGLPRREVEAWKYTNLRPLWDTSFAGGSAVQEADAGPVLDALLSTLGDENAASARLVFLNGLLSDGLSRLPGSVTIRRTVPQPLPAGLHPMLALNQMLSADGVAIEVPAGLDGGRLLVIGLGSAEHAPADWHARVSIALGAGASLSVLQIDQGTGCYLSNAAITVSVAEGASLRHARLQRDAASAMSFALVHAQIAERGSYDVFNLALGATLARFEVHARLVGAQAAVHVNGAQLLDGEQVADLTSVISHDAPNCNSRQTVKNVLQGRARGVFQGKIVVARPAQKTDGYQMNQALLLSEQAEIDAKPELEIYADDVKCSHGATVGALDEEQLFYLRSRGVPVPEARAMLVQAFLLDAIELVQDEPFRQVLDDAIATWWAGRAA
ncbi:Fe-S cluster assembly protein SufD [Rhizosaccharibacter radicis]|uniref:Fe-S cluster assembly protein SufD n=1 Tax=Rhizosaccharibacter radicis TaxID=2782605 RepID=A0ABT1VYF7_9PROT|nr:Fe-S cluster assembly protein SufD [Acetobacteraceae bacterium KSS12]